VSSPSTSTSKATSPATPPFAGLHISHAEQALGTRSARSTTDSDVPSTRLDEPRRIEIDGDGFGTANSVRAWIEPEGLTIRVPQDPAAEEPPSASLHRR